MIAHDEMSSDTEAIRCRSCQVPSTLRHGLRMEGTAALFNSLRWLSHHGNREACRKGWRLDNIL